jgi:hypothetical protein
MPLSPRLSETLMNRMSRSALLQLPALLTAIAVPEARAVGPSRYLQSSVSFSSATQLYTYRYVVNNTTGISSIGELALLVDSSGYNVAPNPNHIPHMKPAGYRISEATSGNIEEPPYSIVGTLFVWVPLDLTDPIPRGGTLGGFSFSAPFPPATGQNNNYFLYSFDDRRVVDYGRVIAPDFRGMFVVPEPSASILAALAAMFAGSKQRRRQPLIT